MDILRVISIILRIPLHLFLLCSFGASIYAAVNKIQGISWGTPVLFGAILVTWYIGVWLNRYE
jgi:uncharacterized membrane protein (DUF485 family)